MALLDEAALEHRTRDARKAVMNTRPRVCLKLRTQVKVWFFIRAKCGGWTCHEEHCYVTVKAAMFVVTSRTGSTASEVRVSGLLLHHHHHQQQQQQQQQQHQPTGGTHWGASRRPLRKYSVHTPSGRSVLGSAGAWMAGTPTLSHAAPFPCVQLRLPCLGRVVFLVFVA